MTIFAVELDNGKRADLFVEGTRINPFFVDYFNGKIKVHRLDESQWVIFSVQTPIPAPFGLYAFLAAVGIIVLRGASWWLVLPAIVALAEIPRSRWFWYFMLRRSLARHNYTGKFRLVKTAEVLDLVMRT